jgi:hypothetical protein
LLVWIDSLLPADSRQRVADSGLRPVGCPQRVADSSVLVGQYQCLQAVQCPELPADIDLVACSTVHDRCLLPVQCPELPADDCQTAAKLVNMGFYCVL